MVPGRENELWVGFEKGDLSVLPTLCFEKQLSLVPGAWQSGTVITGGYSALGLFQKLLTPGLRELQRLSSQADGFG